MFQNIFRLALPCFLLVCPGSGLAFPELKMVASEPDAVAFVNATVVVRPGEVIESATVVCRDGLIEAVGADVQVPFDARVHDCSGMVIYPGFMDAGTTRGLPDREEDGRQTGSGADRGDIDLATQIAASTREVNRKGIFPEYSSARHIAVSEEDARDWRKSGFTTVHVMPSGELLNGTSTIVALVDPDRNAVRNSILVPDFAAVGGWNSSGRGYPTSLMGSIAHLRQTFLDARHYETSWDIYNRVRSGVPRPPNDAALAALGDLINARMPVIFPASHLDDVYRARNLAEEFGLQLILDGVQNGYELTDELKALGAPVMVRLDFRDEPELGKTPETRRRLGGFGGFGRGGDDQEEVDKRIPVARGVLEDQMNQWQAELGNPGRLAAAGIEMVLSTEGTADSGEFMEQLRLAMEHGLDPDQALAALTTVPAGLFGLSDQLGTLEPGKLASLVVMTDPFNESDSRVRYTVVAGDLFEYEEEQETGRDERPGRGKGGKRGRGRGGRRGQRGSGGDQAEEPASEEADDAAAEEEEPEDDQEIPLVDWPVETDESRIPATRTGGNVLIQNANVITAVNGELTDTSILVENGVIAAIGKDLVPPPDVMVIDGQGAWVMPGIIDCHSHMVAGGNEGSLSVTPEVRCEDNMRSDDLSVYRAAAGGATTANVLHGSANTIGGQRIVIQMKYGANPRDMLFPGFKPGIKFALGENVIRSENRYPNTRMGVESVLRMAFGAARQYQADWNAWHALSAGEQARTIPPRRDLRLETLQQVLNNEILVHCHCYNAGEILMLLQTFTRNGIENLTLEHGLEAYKIAPEIARFGKQGAHLSTFADFWGYKVEAYDAVPYNVALIQAAGGIPILNSDSGERVRRLNHDAAKMVRWGNMSYQDAIRTITLNPAIALQIDDVTGSVEVGKKADLALFNGHPLNTFSRPFMTLIDGEVVFERAGQRGGPWPLADKPGIPASLPASNPGGLYAIVNAQVHTGAGPPIPRGTVVIRDGLIESAGGPGTPVPENATVVDGSGLQVYPGLIDGGSTVANSDLGLSDAGEQGLIKPDLQASSALKPDSPLIGLARFTGATCSVTTPTSGLISGQSALVQYDGWNFDDLTVEPRLALEMVLPSKEIGELPRERRRFGPPRRSSGEDDEAGESPQPRYSPHEMVVRLFAETREYDRVKQEAVRRGVRGPDYDGRLEAMIPYARKEKPVVIGVNSASEILDAIEFAGELDIRAVLRDSGSESWKVADQLAEAGIPILIGPVTRSVRSRWEPYDTNYALPARLHEAGVLFAFYSGSNTMARDLPLSAGLAVGFGLPEEVALAALTSNTARIFGIDDRVGTLEPGKRADLIVTDRSPLQATSNVIHMFIGGRPVDVDDNFHTELYNKYQQRLETGK